MLAARGANATDTVAGAGFGSLHAVISAAANAGTDVYC